MLAQPKLRKVMQGIFKTDISLFSVFDLRYKEQMFIFENKMNIRDEQALSGSAMNK